MSPIEWEYTFEVQLGWFPGAGWLRAQYFRDTWDKAMDEARQYAEFGQRNGHVVSIRVIRVDLYTGRPLATDRPSTD